MKAHSHDTCTPLDFFSGPVATKVADFITALNHSIMSPVWVTASLTWAKFVMGRVVQLPLHVCCFFYQGLQFSTHLLTGLSYELQKILKGA